MIPGVQIASLILRRAWQQVPVPPLAPPAAGLSLLSLHTALHPSFVPTCTPPANVSQPCTPYPPVPTPPLSG